MSYEYKNAAAGRESAASRLAQAQLGTKGPYRIVQNLADRPDVSVNEGLVIYQLDTNKMYVSDGTSWVDLWTAYSDGASSGLDADLLDGQHGSYFLDRANHTGTQAFSTVTGTVPVGQGGTNLTSYTTGDLLYASGTSTLSKLADVATGNALISGGVGVAPSWGQVQLNGTPTHVAGTLQVANGGSGATTLTGYVKGSGTSAFTASSTIPASDLANAAPTSYTPTFGGITLGNGTVAGGYSLVGPLCFWYAFLRQGSTTTRSATILSVTLPVTARTFATQQELAGAVEVFYVDNSINPVIFWHGTGKYGTTTLELEDLSNNAQGTDDTNTMAANGTDPFGAAWGTDDKIMVKGWYWRA